MKSGTSPFQIRLLSQSKVISKYDLSCLKVVITSGSVLSSTIKMELQERFPNLRYIREAYGLNECGLVTLTYPRYVILICLQQIL